MNDNNKLPPSSRIVAYLRDSGGRDQNMSIAQQETAVVDWARRNDAIITRIFKDTSSGTRVAGRDQFLAMIDYLAGKVPEVALILWDYSRFARDYDDTQYYLANIRRQGYKIFSVNEDLPDSLEGRLMEGIIAWKDAFFSRQLSANVQRGMKYVVAMYHAKPGGTIAVGYTTESVVIGSRRDGTPHTINLYKIDQDKAPLVRRAFEMRAAGASLQEIHDATHLGAWLSTYAKILKNPIYIGTMVYGGREYPEFCDPIIDMDTWKAVQAVNEARAEATGPNHPRAVRSRFILSGMVYCGICGQKMIGNHHTQRQPWTSHHDYYRCQSNKKGGSCGAPPIDKTELEGRVIEVVREQVLNPNVLSDLYAQVQQQAESGHANWESEVAQLQAKLSSVSAQITRLVAAIRDAGHSSAMLEALAELERKQRDIEEQIARAEAHPPSVIEIDAEAIAREATAALDNSTDQEKAIILRGFIKRIVASKNGKITGSVECYVAGTEDTISVNL